MGQHSSGQQWPYYRSLVGWLLPWTLIAAVVGVAVWVAIDFLGQGELEAPPPRRGKAVAERGSPSPTPSESPSPVAQKTPARGDRVKDRRVERERKERADGQRNEDRPPALITEGITVQVLNATATPGAATTMGQRLEGLGYDVVALESASGSYPRTVVYWSYPEAQDAADALAARFGWRAGLRPANLSPTVDLHVVVGEDEA